MLSFSFSCCSAPSRKIVWASIRDPLHDAAQPILMTKHRCIRNLFLASSLFHCTVELSIFLLERFTSTKNPFTCATLSVVWDIVLAHWLRGQVIEDFVRCSLGIRLNLFLA